MTRTIASALVGFSLVSPVAFSGGGWLAQSAIVMAFIGCGTAVGLLRGRDFLNLAVPVPEVFLALSWLAFSIGAGYLWTSASLEVAVLFLLLAPAVALGGWLWSTAQFLRQIRLQPLVAAISTQLSAIYFVSLIVKI